MTTEEQIDKYVMEMNDACKRVGVQMREAKFAASFARDFGFGLASCGASERQVQTQTQLNYGRILVACTGLQPPFDMKQWAKSIMEGYKSYERI